MTDQFRPTRMIIYSLAVVFLYVFFVSCSSPSDTALSVEDSLNVQQDKQYQRQLDETDREMKVMERQTRRYNDLLDRWEQQADRMDRVLEAMERQYGLQLEDP